MTRTEINRILGAVLIACAESEPAPVPESTVYIALGMDLQKWEAIRGLLIGGGLADSVGYGLRLTDKGRAVAEMCEQALQKGTVAA